MRLTSTLSTPEGGHKPEDPKHLGARRGDAEVSMASRTWMSFKGSLVLLTAFGDIPWRKES